ncbi:UNVERIFIED_CONTAM: activating signal cointegrator 1 complex subunit [Gekko kuhli]
MNDIIVTVRESNLKLTLAFGIGIHHAGLHERDRKTVEELFVNCKIQVLIATSTLAWGVNFPAHLVIVKGTEYYDGKTRRYVDYPITDVLQMMGRAGRPQFDDQGKAVILVHDIKKDFYKKFLYEPFPVESSLLEVLSDHLNAEIAAGTISSKQDAMDYITWTYFFRRLIMNPRSQPFPVRCPASSWAFIPGPGGRCSMVGDGGAVLLHGTWRRLQEKEELWELNDHMATYIEGVQGREVGREALELHLTH